MYNGSIGPDCHTRKSERYPNNNSLYYECIINTCRCNSKDRDNHSFVRNCVEHTSSKYCMDSDNDSIVYHRVEYTNNRGNGGLD